MNFELISTLTYWLLVVMNIIINSAGGLSTCTFLTTPSPLRANTVGNKHLKWHVLNTGNLLTIHISG